MKPRRILIPLLLIIVLLPSFALAHSGRTDSSGGHKDNKNKSGLGSYHYHCGGYSAHLHSGGVCPYSAKAKPKATPTAKAKRKATPVPVKYVDGLEIPTNLPLKVGSKNNSVKSVQQALIATGHLNGKADGIFGQQTEKAVVQFCDSLPEPIKYNGYVDENIYISLMKAIAQYIGNKNDMKFHYNYCTQVGEMNAENKVELPSRAFAIDQGYVPCEVCVP